MSAAQASRGLRLLLGLAALAVLYVAVVQLGDRLLGGRQLDLTHDHLYTLAPGTVEIARSPREPVHLTLYYTRHAMRDLPQLRTYAQRVRTLLEEIQRASRERVHVSVVDPQPYSADEDRALAAGLSALPTGVAGQRVIFGLVGTNATDGIAVIPFLQPDKEAFLEYDVARLIHELVMTQRPLVGLISGLPVEGAPGGADAPGVPAWTTFQQLGQLFRVRQLDPATLQHIPHDMRVVLLVQPQNLPPPALEAIRAYLLDGGHLAVFIDPDPESLAPEQARASALASWHALEPLFHEWGVAFDPTRVVADPDLARNVSQQPGMLPQPDPVVLGLGRSELSHDDVITAGLRSINVATAGSFEQVEQAPLHLVPLLQSGGDAGTVSVREVLSAADPQALLDHMKATGGRYYVLAARLNGPLAPGARSADIVLVADTDLLTDRLWTRNLPFFGQALTQPFANNGDFFLNVVDNLSGSSALISIRGRAVAARPFTRIQTMRQQAEHSSAEQRATLQQQLARVEQRLLEIEQMRSGGAATDLHVAEYRLARERRSDLRQALRQIQRQSDARVQRLRLRIETLDIVAVPALLAILALLLAVLRRWRGRSGES